MGGGAIRELSNGDGTYMLTGISRMREREIEVHRRASVVDERHALVCGRHFIAPVRGRLMMTLFFRLQSPS